MGAYQPRFHGQIRQQKDLGERMDDSMQWVMRGLQMKQQQDQQGAALKMDQDRLAISKDQAERQARAEERMMAMGQVDALAKIKTLPAPLQLAAINAFGGKNITQEDSYERPGGQVAGGMGQQPQAPSPSMPSATGPQPSGYHPIPGMTQFGGTDSEAEGEPPPVNPLVRAAQMQQAARMENPAVKMAQAQQAQRQPSADFDVSGGGQYLGKKIGFDLNGQRIEMDPREEFMLQKAQRERLARSLKGAYGDEQDDILALASIPGITGPDIVKEIGERREERRRRGEKREDRDWKETENKLDREARAANTATMARGTAARQNNVTPGAESAGAGQVLGAIRSDVKDFRDAQSYDKVSAELVAANSALQSMKSGNPKAVQNAMFGYGKSTAGVGSFTAAEQEAILNRTGGAWDQVANKLSLAFAGEYNPETLKVFQVAMEVKQAATQSQMRDIHGAFRSKFRDGVAYQNVQQNVADDERALFGRYGLAAETPAEPGGVSYGTPKMKSAGPKKPTVGAKVSPRDLARGIIDGVFGGKP